MAAKRRYRHMRSGKYRPLWMWLQRQDDDVVRVTFGRLERELGFTLPIAARTRAATWRNPRSSALARAIAEAGWTAVTVTLPPARTPAVVLQRVETPPLPPQPWVPDTLQQAAGVPSQQAIVAGDAAFDRSQWLYVVVDDVVDGVAGLSVAEWPERDFKGRLTFTLPDEYRDLWVRVADLHEILVQLRRFRTGPAAPVRLPGDQDLDPGEEAFRARQVAIGDAFAMNRPALRSLAAAAAGRRRPPNRRAIVVDLSAEGRAEAKMAMYAAVAPTLREQRPDDRELIRLAEVEAADGPVASGSLPGRGGGDG